MLHFELALILLLLLVYCYAFVGRVVVPFLMEGQWLSQDLSSREIHQHLAATISMNLLVVLLAMMGTHSKVLAVAAMIVILTVIPQLVPVIRSYEIGQAAGRRCVCEE
jgi:hypothetical protein